MKELLLFGFIVTSALSSEARPEQEALQNASIALYKQSGLEEVIQNTIDRQIPDDVKLIAGNILMITKTIKEQKISYAWSF